MIFLWIKICCFLLLLVILAGLLPDECGRRGFRVSGFCQHTYFASSKEWQQKSAGHHVRVPLLCRILDAVSLRDCLRYNVCRHECRYSPGRSFWTGNLRFQKIEHSNEPMKNDRAAEIMRCCALQFDGYEYFKRVHGATDNNVIGLLEKSAKTLLKTFQLFPDEEENWCVFFFLQRKLDKDMPGFLATRTKEQKLAALLFLHLYARNQPHKFFNVEFAVKWKRITTEEREDCAGHVHCWLNPNPMSLKKALFTLRANRWYGMQLWEDHAVHHSPIRMNRVHPLKTGGNELEIDFFHAFYHPGVQFKTYRLRILFRAGSYLLANCPDEDNRCVWIGQLTAEWLKPHVDQDHAYALEQEPDLNAYLDRIYCIDESRG